MPMVVAMMVPMVVSKMKMPRCMATSPHRVSQVVHAGVQAVVVHGVRDVPVMVLDRMRTVMVLDGVVCVVVAR